MKNKIAKRLAQSKRKIQKRLAKRSQPDKPGPMLNPGNIQYEIAGRNRGITCGGIGAVQMLVQKLELDKAINRDLPIFKLYNPYMESDHVLNIAYNILCNGECIEDIERLRNDEVYLDAVGAKTIPDPTTAGDFCRRFSVEHVERLQNIINEVRLKVWGQQEPEFFRQAVIDADGTIAPTTGECKEGMDISYKGVWGYHPLVVSLSNTGEPLYLCNRSGNSTSSKNASHYLDKAAKLCRAAGFKKIRFRGDTDFSQTAYLDKWDTEGITFVFGINAMPNLIGIAENLPQTAYTELSRPPKYTVKTEPRSKPVNVREEIVRLREYKNIRLVSEHTAEFEYRPIKCDRPYRIVVLRKNLSVEKGENVLFDDIRYFFYITNDRKASRTQIVGDANNRCNQENLISQLKTGVNAMKLPVDNLVSNWAYMVMACLAWNLKAWYALLLPVSPRWEQKHKRQKDNILRMEFKKFSNFFVMLPCQIVKTGRRLLYRLLGWNEYLEIFFRALDCLSRPLRC
ncbi:MAG: IS1380 family transposase [Planctomycetes bacterium]|nr:IS1380 family transposase [Planctomycetota bacterium]